MKKEHLKNCVRSIGLVLCVVIMNVAVAPNSLADERNLGFETYGVSYLIEDKRVEELFYVTLEAFSYINDIELKFHEETPRSILAISVKDFFVEGKIDSSKPLLFNERDKEIVSSLDVSEGVCQIGGVKSTVYDGDGNETEYWRTVVLFDIEEAESETQLVCLYSGVLASFGLNFDQIEGFSNLSSKEFMKNIINMDFSK